MSRICSTVEGEDIFEIRKFARSFLLYVYAAIPPNTELLIVDFFFITRNPSGYKVGKNLSFSFTSKWLGPQYNYSKPDVENSCINEHSNPR